MTLKRGKLVEEEIPQEYLPDEYDGYYEEDLEMYEDLDIPTPKEEDEEEFQSFTDEIVDMIYEHENKRETLKDVKHEFKDKEKAKSFIKNCQEYLNSKEFNDKCNQLSTFHRITGSKVAENFSQKVLGTIGDVLGIVIKVTYNSLKFLVSLLNKVLASSVGIICTIASKLTSFFTFGYTCKLG